MLTNQPLYPAAPDTTHLALAGVSASIIAAGDPSGWMRNAGSRISAPALNGAIALDTTALGNALVFDGTSTYLSYGAANIPAAEFTVLFGGIFDSFDNYRGVADCTVNGASGWNIFQTAGGGLWFSVNGYAGSLLSSGWPTGTVVHGALRNRNGVTCDWFRDGVNIASASGKNPGAVTNPLWIGNQRGSGLPFLSGRFAYFYLLDKYLDDLSIAAIAANPWQLFQPEGEDAWVPSNERGLSATGPVQKNASGIAGIGQVQPLAPAASAQIQATGEEAVAQSHMLAGAASAQGNLGVSMPALQGHSLLPVPATQANRGEAGEVELVAASGLLVAGSMQRNTVSTTAVIMQKHLLAVPSWSMQGNASGAGLMLSTHYLITANPAQANTCGAAIIGETFLLAVAASRQSNRAQAAAMAGAMIESALARGHVQQMRIKKPGIPNGTPEWLKTMMEILTGRRGNRIEAPKFQQLTFSPTPTQAECEALYSYTNAVRTALEQVIARTDG